MLTRHWELARDNSWPRGRPAPLGLVKRASAFAGLLMCNIMKEV